MQPTENVPVAPEAQPPQVAGLNQQQPVQAGQPYKQSTVTYKETMWQRNNPKNQYAAILEWGSDNRIRLYAYKYQGQESAILFNCAPQEIAKFSTGMGVGDVKLRDGRTFSLQFSSQVGNLLMTSGIAQNFGPVGMVASTAIDKNAVEVESKTDLEWWTQNLKKFGVGGLQMTANSMYKVDKIGWWSLGIFIGLIILFMLLAGVIYIISALGIA